MNYLYSEKTVSNPVDTILLFERYILVHHHATLKVYDLSFALQYEKYFIDKILSLRKIGDTSIVILFDRGKIVQCTLSFTPTCLRVIDGDYLDSYNNNCVVYNKIKAHTFGIYEEEVKEFYYSMFEIYNVQNISYMVNYIPTLLISWKTNDSSVCSIINLDGVPTKVDEFEILEDTTYYKPLDRFIVFLTRNCIQIKFKREMTILIVNGNLQRTSLKPHFSQCVIEHSSDGSHEAQSIFIENPQVFGKGDDLFVVNGNGELFKISLDLDVKKILKAHISFEGKVTEPSCADMDGDHVVLGSLRGSSALYTFSSHADRRGISSYSLSELSRLQSIGLICDLSHDVNGDIHLLTTKGVYITQRFVSFQPHEKVKVEAKVTNLGVADDNLVVYMPDRISEVKLLDSLSESIPIVSNKGSSRGYEPTHGIDPSHIQARTKQSDYEIVHLNDGTLTIFNKKSKVRSFSDVLVWSFVHELLAVVTPGVLLFGKDKLLIEGVDIGLEVVKFALESPSKLCLIKCNLVYSLWFNVPLYIGIDIFSMHR